MMSDLEKYLWTLISKWLGDKRLDPFSGEFRIEAQCQIIHDIDKPPENMDLISTKYNEVKDQIGCLSELTSNLPDKVPDKTNALAEINYRALGQLSHEMVHSYNPAVSNPPSNPSFLVPQSEENCIYEGIVEILNRSILSNELITYTATEDCKKSMAKARTFLEKYGICIDEEYYAKNEFLNKLARFYIQRDLIKSIKASDSY